MGPRLERCVSLPLLLQYIPALSGIEQHKFIISVLQVTSLGWGRFQLVSLLGVSQAEIMASASRALLCRRWGRIGFRAQPGGWHSSGPCSHSTGVSVSRLAVNQRSFSASRGCLHSLAPAPLHLQSQLWPVESFSCFESL